jgi:hypothetical protein
VLEAIPKPQFENLFYLDLEYKGEKMLGHKTEDVDFCEKAQRHGYHIYVDTRIRSPHYQGEACFPDSWRQYEESKNDVVEIKCDKISMPEGATVIPLKDFQD